MEFASLTTVVTLINIILALGFLFIERREAGYTWAWLMVLFFIPILGFVLYIFFGRNLKKKNFYKLFIEEQEYVQAEADKQLAAFAEGADDRSQLLQNYAQLINMNIRSSHGLLSNDNDIVIYSDGHQKFAALFADIRSARAEINIQYYIIQPDALGKQLRDELTRKAREGVKVRLLYDEVGSKRISRHFFRELRAAGGEVEVFFPSLIKPLNFRINNRNHRKLCIIDGSIAYIGGFNVGDEYLGQVKKFGYWRDTHLRITGNAVSHIQGRFILDWHQAGKHERGDYGEFVFNMEQHTGTSPVQIITSGPNSSTEHLKNMYIKLILSAKESVYIQTPYFIPDTSFMDACKIALLSGVDLQIMIPNKPDHPFVYWATWAYAGDLLNYGAKILLYENGFLHAKTIVADGEVASVGTMNIDSRSFRLNFEVNAIVYDRAIAEQLQDIFLNDVRLCSELTVERYAQRSLVIKLKEGISRLLSPIL
ncbi:cardiolipin synthase [Paenibacillus sp. FSL P4-0338]|uniref:cardiolipin synthase n=1 Tax=unclassified Paenibacillus TaxID=185978 RepID=UPI0003E24122|nr:cardiolipin synthase [Paenibacillus sp. FSL R7-269]ETT40354.1 Phosphatidylserine/phosphatidylglycerophosphate/ cardiolipin synthase enzymes-like protein [Paenibacillus sp. FSL R7-269]